MLGVRAEFRDCGVGRRLKLAQREDALTRGIDLIEWTFDPLEIKNAYLNIEKLGAIARRYNVDQYGSSASPLQGGLPTDRLIAEITGAPRAAPYRSALAVRISQVHCEFVSLLPAKL